MHELNRFLDRDDVPRKIVVDVIDQRRQRRRFAGTGWAGDKDQSATQTGKLFGDDWNAKLFQCCDFRRNQAKHRAIAVRLL